MLKGTLTYRALVKDFIFRSFPPFEVKVAGADKVTVACPGESPIEVVMTFSGVPTAEVALIAGKQICRTILNRLALKYCLCIQEPMAPEELWRDEKDGVVVNRASSSLPCFVSGKDSKDVKPEEIPDLKADLEHADPPGGSHYDLFRVAIQTEDLVDRFLSLYRILSLLFPRPGDKKEDQKFVDDYIENNTPERRVFERPDKKGVYETVYSRLRNEIAHVRPGVNLVATRTEMESRVHAFADVVKKAILQI